jgi:hypothetical protein
MSKANGITSPMLSSYWLSMLGTNTLLDPNLYRSILEDQCATITKLDISFSENKVCNFISLGFLSLIERQSNELSSI